MHDMFVLTMSPARVRTLVVLLVGLLASVMAGCAPELEEPAEDAPLRQVSQAMTEPEVDLNGGGMNLDFNLSYTEGDGTVAAIDPGATISGAVQLSSVVVAFDSDNDFGTAEPLPDGVDEVLSVDVGATGLEAGVVLNALVITGPGQAAADIGDFQTVLRTLTYTNSSDAPTEGDRVIGVIATDAGGNSNSPSLLTVTVTGANDSPVITVPGDQSAQGGQTINIAGVSVADPDALDADLTTTITVTGGTATLGGLADLTFSTGDGEDDTSMEFDSTLTELNVALAALSFTADGDPVGTIDITVNDNGASGDGDANALSDSDTITINVNSPPTVTTNAGVTVSNGATVTIGSNELLVEDDEQGAAEVEYTLTVAPVVGELRNNDVALAVSDTFTQDDINNNLLTYVHGGTPSTSDGFGFNLADGVGGTLNAQSFAITITNDAPTLSNNGVNVQEGGAVNIGLANLSANDNDSDDDQLVFTVVGLPQFGALKLNGATLSANDTFDQDDLVASALSYEHNGNEETADTFVFNLTDGINNLVGQTFSVTIDPVNDPPTLVNNNTLTVSEGATGTIVRNRLRVDDVDSNNNEITFTVVTSPQRGVLLNAGVQIPQGGSFTQADVNNSDVTYEHDADEEFDDADTFVFTVSDGAGGVINDQTFNISINLQNDPPTIDTLTGDLSGQEFANFAFNATATDPEGGVLNYRWEYGDGDSEQADNQTSVNHVYRDNDTVTLRLTVTDDGGASDTAELTVTINNVAPTVTISGDDPVIINEGTDLPFSGSVVDPGQDDTLTYTWVYDDGTDPDEGVDLDSTSHVFDDNGTFIVTLRVNDGDDNDQDNVTVVVNNVAPTAAAGDDIIADEGDLVAFDGTISDPSAADEAALTFVWDFDDNGATNTQDIDPSHTYVQEGVYVAQLSVSDDDGGSDSDTVRVTINNVAPAFELGNDVTVDEGVTQVFSVNVVDPGQNDTLTYTWELGDGNTREGVNLTEVSHQYTEPGAYTLRLTVDDGTDSTTDTLTVTVGNVQPAVDFTIPASGDEGQELTFSATATEPGTADPNALTYTWEFGDGTVLADAGPGEVTHTYVDEGDGTFSVRLSVADGEGAATVIDREVAVTNLPPVAAAGRDDSVDEGTAYTFQGSATDAGAQDVLTYSWQFGGFGSDSGVNLTGPQFVFFNNGRVNVDLTVDDGDGGSDTDRVQINVNNVAPSVSLGNNRTIIQGTPFSFASSVTDPGDSETNDELLDYVWEVACDDVLFPGCATGFEFVSDSQGRRLEEVSILFSVPATYQLTLTVSDKDGGSGTDTIDVDVQNEVPLVTVEVDEVVIDEGDSVALLATAVDVGLDALRVNIDFDDGTTETINNHAPDGNGNYPDITRDHLYAQEGDYTIEVEAFDTDLARGNASVGVRVNNVAPQIVLNNVTGQEGVELSITAQVTDPGDDTLVYTWTFGDGQSDVTDEASTTHQYAQDGEYNLTLSVNDGTDTSIAQAVVTITNRLPQVTFNDFNANEGVEVTISATATDVPADTLNFTWDFGDGSEPKITNVPQVTHAFPDNGNFTVQLSTRDDDGVTNVSARATVANVRPVVTVGDNITQPEGSRVNFRGVATDVPADTLTYTWDFGDGTTETGVNLTEVSHEYDDDEQRTVRLTVNDGDDSSSDTLRVTFTNLAPTANAGAPIFQREEGSEVRFQGEGTDPGNDELVFTWDFGDGDGDSAVGLNRPRHTYVDEGNYQVELVVDDQEGGTATDTTVVEVINVAPTALLPGVGPVDEGEVVTFSASSVDPGNDTLEFCWTFGDNTGEFCQTPAQNVAERDYADTITHAFPDNGTFTVSVRVNDGDNGQETAQIQVVSNNVAPSIVCNPPTLAQTSEEYTHNFQVNEPGSQDTLTYTIIEPSNATIDDEGRLSFITELLEGEIDFTLRVADDDGAFDICEWTVTIGFGDRDNDSSPDVCEEQFDCLDPDVAEANPDFDLDGIPNAEECRNLNVFNPCESNVPTPPSIRTPADGDVVAVSPVAYAINNAFDGEGDLLTYIFEVYEERVVGEPLIDLEGVPQSLPFTSTSPAFEYTENAQYCWRSAAFDGAGRSDFSDTACFIFSATPEAPGEPEAREPTVSTNTTQPAFVWTNVEDPERQEVTYRVEISQDGELVFTSNALLPDEGPQTRFTALPPGVLEENESYSWRVVAVDDGGLESLRTPRSTRDFVVNTENVPPGAVEFIFPDSGGVLEDAANFMVVTTEAIDEDGDEVFYDFRLSSDPDFQNELAAAIGVTAADGVVVWDEDLSAVEFAENQSLFVTVRARDSLNQAGPSATLELVFSGEGNDPPEQVVLLGPLGEEASVSPRFRWSNAADPEGEAVVYEFTIATFDDAMSPFLTLTGIPAGSGEETEILLPEALKEDTTYIWTVRAFDARGLEGERSDPGEVSINVGDTAPGAATPLSPIDDVVLENGDDASFVWSNAVDPDGDDVSYLLTVLNASGLPVGVGAIEVEEGGDGMTAVDLGESLPPGNYTWTVLSTTNSGAVRGLTSNTARFSVAQPEVEEFVPPTSCQDYVDAGLEPPDSCAAELEAAATPGAISGCQQSFGGAAPGGLLWFLALLMTLGLLRRSSPRARVASRRVS